MAHQFLSLEHRMHEHRPLFDAACNVQWLCRARVFLGALSVIPTEKVLHPTGTSSSWPLVLLNSHQILGFRCEFWACLHVASPFSQCMIGTCMLPMGLTTYNFLPTPLYISCQNTNPPKGGLQSLNTIPQ